MPNTSLPVIEEHFLVAFDLLSGIGNVGFFESCQVTQISIYRQGSDIPTNLFTHIKFLETPVVDAKIQKLGMFRIDNDNRIAAVRFHVTVVEARETLSKLIKYAIFDACGYKRLEINIDRFLPKKFYPGDFDYRMKHALGIESSGAYILEGVDQCRLHLESVKLILNNRKIIDKHFEKIQTATSV